MILPEYPFEWQEGMYQQMFVNEAINNYVPSSWGVLKQSANYAFHDNSFVHVSDYIDSLTDSEVISEEQFKEKGYAESGVQYKEGMTDTQANVLQQMNERDKFYATYMKNTSMLSFGGITGMIAGSIPDPINYIPFVGWAGRISKVARIANKMPMLAMSANAMAGQTAFEVVKQTHLKSLGRDVNWLGAMADVGIAGVLGFGFGGLGKLSKLRNKIARTDQNTHQQNLAVALTTNGEGTPTSNMLINDLDPVTTTPPAMALAINDIEFRQKQIKLHQSSLDKQSNEFKQEPIDLQKREEGIINYNNCRGIL
jgi:hypothetical protein